MVDGMQRCKIIARSGIGVDTIPVGRATQKGIKVTNVPDYCIDEVADHTLALMLALRRGVDQGAVRARQRSEEHTSELQSLMRISYAVFCLKKKNQLKQQNNVMARMMHSIGPHIVEDTVEENTE